MLVRKNNKIVVGEAVFGSKKSKILNGRLLRACSKGNLNLDEVKSLLEAGADPNTKNNIDQTPLYMALRMGHTAIVKMLLEAGADPNTQDRFGQTPLFPFVLASSGVPKEEIGRLLLDAGADPNIQNNDGETPLFRAVELCLTGIIKLLLEAGANPNITDIVGRTPLHTAATFKHIDITKCLLAAGADPNIKDTFGRTPLDYARRINNTNNMQLLLDYTLDEVDINAEDENGDTSLALMIQLNNLKNAKELIKDGADINHISIRRAYMDRRYRNNETAKYVEDLVNNPKKKSKFDF